ncbi:hypothetical protein AB9Q10_20030 [Streptomyces krungchingensis]|uniref:hypothetical protein n=1 Tax=Streptomyces krungchingensis TaxID=1565034 RepID=UPI003CE9ECA9
MAALPSTTNGHRRVHLPTDDDVQARGSASEAAGQAGEPRITDPECILIPIIAPTTSGTLT